MAVPPRHPIFYVIFVLAQSAEVPFPFDFDKHICGVCHEIIYDGISCDVFDACGVVNSSSAREKCKKFCPSLDAKVNKPPPIPCSVLDVRITKGFGTKPYDQVRISVISSNKSAPVSDFFDYSAQFKYRWTHMNLHSSMKAAKPGEYTTFNVGDVVRMKLPAQGAGTAGVLIADPCMGDSSIISFVGCRYGNKFKTYTRTVELLNTFVPDDSTDFWGILGDNFYDRTGEMTTDVFRRLSLQTKSKLFMSAPGNHDYWVMGIPSASTVEDQCANGFMQFYAQDSKASELVVNGNKSAPFDLSVDPSSGRHVLGCSLPAMSNFFWYNQIGNIGFVGQSAAYTYADARPFTREACAWLGSQPGIQVAVLVGHWDWPDTGATMLMAMPTWFIEMKDLPGCSKFHEKGKLKFVMGHTHCNNPHPHGHVGAGFRVAGYGMEGCGNYGLPILDTTEGRVRFWYWDTSSDALYNRTISCVRSKGWRNCTNLATVWLDEPIDGPETGPEAASSMVSV